MGRTAWGHGLTTRSHDGTTLDAWFPWLGFEGGDGVPAPEDADAVLARAERTDERRGVAVSAVRLSVDVDAAPTSPADVYLRLHLLSHRLARPRSLNLDGIFGHLVNVAWTDLGPVPLDRLDAVRLAVRAAGGQLVVRSVDKFPPLLDYVAPAGVRVADGTRVRLGAHLAEGTTVMHEGFCNYNAGTLGASMVEGRISQGVIVGAGSDVGGGASIMGTLSGGGTEVVTIGERCLLGANSGLGISLGDDCVVEAGLYVTAGTPVTLPDGEVVKARQLSGAHGLLFLRNGLTGTVEVRPRKGSWGGLNAALHAN